MLVTPEALTINDIKAERIGPLLSQSYITVVNYTVMRVGFICMALAFSCVAFAQITEPEFSDTFFRLDNGTLRPLERQSAERKVKASGFIVVNAKGILEIPGRASPVRFHEGELEFVVRSQSASTSVDPSGLYHLRKLSVSKKSRMVILSKAHASPIGASANSVQSDGLISLRFSRYGESSYKINAPSLAAGEYALGMSGGLTLFCFGVD